MKITKRSMKISFVVSMLVALFFAIGNEIAFSSSFKVQSSVDWTQLELLSQQNGEKYLLEHTTPISGFESLLMQSSYPEFWISLSKTFFAFFLPGFISCVAVFWWSQKNNKQCHDPV